LSATRWALRWSGRGLGQLWCDDDDDNNNNDNNNNNNNNDDDDSGHREMKGHTKHREEAIDSEITSECNARVCEKMAMCSPAMVSIVA
jgi:hypothetical protein